MSRSTFVIPFQCNFDEAQERIEAVLRDEGFDFQTINSGEQVWRKGSNMLGNIRNIKVEYATNQITLSAWVQIGLGRSGSEEMDYNNPDVALFVKQLKSGTYKMKNDKGVVEVPHFTEEDIPELLKYAEDLTIIPSFPSVYNMNNGKIRLGECMLWVIESIRQGTPPSLGCKMVLANAENYEAIYFLTDEEVFSV